MPGVSGGEMLPSPWRITDGESFVFVRIVKKENRSCKLHLVSSKDLYQHLVETGGGEEQGREMTHRKFHSSN